jgi:hypothetical protein
MALTNKDIDRLFDEHYVGNSAVLKPERDRAEVVKNALKKQLAIPAAGDAAHG